MKTKAHYYSTYSYIGLVILTFIIVLVHYQPVGATQVSFAIGYLLLLLIPANGMLKQKPQMFLLAGYIDLIYLCHGIIETYADPTFRIYGILEIILATVFFVYSMKRNGQLKKAEPKAE